MVELGTALCNITPPLGVSLAGSFRDRKARDIHDDLHARAMVVGRGGSSMAIVIVDLIILERADIDAAKEQIADRCGLPPERVLIACTHTHTGPATAGILGVAREEEYMASLPARIADAVAMAQRRMTRVQWTCGLGHERRLVSNRRFRMKHGGVQMNPPRDSAEILEPEGPVDPDVLVLAFAHPDGTMAGVLGNYALHYVGGGDGLSVSADYFAAFCEEIQQLRGEQFFAALANGCCGQINNVYVQGVPRKQGPYAQMRHAARVLAAEAFKVLEFAEFRDDEPEITASMETLTIPRRQPGGAELERIRRDLQLAGSGNDDRFELYRREHEILQDGPQADETYVQALRIGDVGIVGLPGELFVEFGLEIKLRSPFEQTLVIELANDWIGYIPTQRALAGGGYETWLARSSRAVPEAGEMMVESAVRQLHRLHEGD